MHDKENPMAASTFVYVTYIRTTPEKLWHALTSTEFLKRCWLGTSIESDWKAGSPWRATSPDGTLFDSGEVLESIPQKRLAITWRNEWQPGFNAEGVSRCVYEIEPSGGSVKLTLTHSLERPDSPFIASVSGAWPMVMSNCKSLLETGEAVLVANPRHAHGHFTTAIAVPKSPHEVFHCLTDVSRWWSRDFEGSSKQLNDEFIIHHPNQHYSKQKLVEVVPDKRIVWLVTESRLDWLQKDKQEWTNTRMIFDITTEGDTTTLHFTHEGLVPEKECYASCNKGWSTIINSWLSHFITNGTPSPEMGKAAEVRNRILANTTSSQ
jgi:uncharacterized protein YndB with AHSA1/START domain